MGDDSASARQRLEVLQLAEELGDVAEACRRAGMDRTSFYQWKRRYAERGLDGLADMPPVHLHHPQTTPPDLAERIRVLALAHPLYGGRRIEQILSRENAKVSSVTIQKILSAAGIGSTHDRWLALEGHARANPASLTLEQARFVEQSNPHFRDRHFQAQSAGALVCVDAFSLGRIANLSGLYIHAAIDTFSAYACCMVSHGKTDTAAAGALDNLFIRLHHVHDKSIRSIAIGRRLVPVLKQSSQFENYCHMGAIQYSSTQSPANGFGWVDDLKRTLQDEFIPHIYDRKFADAPSVDDALRPWMRYYNNSRPRHGFPTYGLPPARIVNPSASEEDLQSQILG